MTTVARRSADDRSRHARLGARRAAIAADLFPEEPDRTRPTMLGVVATVVLLAAGAIATLARLPHRAAVDTLWAEDGRVFLSDAMHDGVIHSIFRPYSGYSVLTARVVGAIASAVPLRAAAATVATCSATMAALAAGFVYRALRGHLPATAPRLALGAALVLMPLAAYELVDSGANVMWYLLPATATALLWRQPPLPWAAVAGVVCFFAVASNPLVLLMLPLLALRLFALPLRQWGGAVVGLAAGAIVQLIVVAGAPGLVRTPRPSLVDVGRTYVARVLAASVLGDQMNERLYDRTGWVVIVVVAVSVVALLCVLGWRVPNARGLTAVLSVLQLLLFVEPVVLRWNLLFLPGVAPGFDYSSRFMVTPIFLLWMAVVIGMHRAAGRVRVVLLPVVVMAVALVAVASMLDFTSDGPRSAGERWSSALAAARSSCEAGAASAHVLIPPPTGDWFVDVPCSRLVAAPTRWP